MLVNDAAKRWGGGVARNAARAYPRAEANFTSWIGSIPHRDRLGKVHFADVGEGIVLASIVGQAGYGPSSTPRIRYSALADALAMVAEEAERRGASVHLPRIGTGAAGGDWQVVEQILDDVLVSRSIPTTVYDLPPRRAATGPDLFG